MNPPERAHEAGADAQLDRPFSPAVLADRVRALLAAHDV
jgi:DNA-binding response OmpR family regulator